MELVEARRLQPGSKRPSASEDSALYASQIMAALVEAHAKASFIAT